MGKFFNDQSPIAGFEDYLGKQLKKNTYSHDAKEYESIKIYNFLEYNYFRLKKLAKLLHKKIYNLGSEDFFQDTLKHYQNSIRDEKKELIDILSEQGHPFQKRQEEIYHHFFTRK
jgi:hypothetical protein